MVEIQLTIDARKQTKHEEFFVAKNEDGQYCLYRTNEKGLGILVGRAVALKTERNERGLWFKVENYRFLNAEGQPETGSLSHIGERWTQQLAQEEKVQQYQERRREEQRAAEEYFA